MEDYKGKYEHLLKFINDLYPHMSDYCKEKVDEYFHELKESEDEKIRKELIRAFTVSADKRDYEIYGNGITYRQVLDWLEKQGGKIDAIENLDTEFEKQVSHLIASAINKEHEYNQSYVKWTANALLNYAKHELEKQDKQKPDAKCLLSWSKTDEKMLQLLEGIVKDYWAKAEQEKNEIKIGEASDALFFLKTIQKSPLCWIKCSDGLPNKDGIYLVVTDGRHNDVYDMARYDSIEGWHKASKIIYWMPIPQLNNKCIIEQKPTNKVEPKFKVGDWIVTPDNEVKQIEKVTFGNYWFTDESLYDIIDVDNRGHLWAIQDAKDGDVLSFNDGHGNDSIELIKSITGKKIEFWFCLTNGNRYEVFDGITPYTNLASREDATPATREQRDLLFTKIKEAGYEWDAEKKELKKIEQTYFQKQEWTGYDEKAYEIALLDIDKSPSITKNDSINWLKSLKNRVQPQPKQEWSEEDERMLDRLIKHFDWGGDYRFDKNDCDEAQDWLRSLKDRYTWKPSDEQMATFWDAIYNLNQDGYKWITDMKSLYQDLKKLREE